jgi:uncharacterized RDD family membrane protein YckC
MQEEYTWLTPENVLLRYDIAGPGSRLVAATIDYCLLALGSIILWVGGIFIAGLLSALLGGLAGRAALNGLDAVAGTALLAVTLLLSFLLWWGYFVLCEVLWNGQSIGKRRLQLRVVRADGQPVGLLASLVRNLLRLIDLFLLVGVLVMLLDRSSRRLGDFAAGTVVIREPSVRKHDLTSVLRGIEIPVVAEAQLAALPNAGRLTAEHYALLREFFTRRPRLDPKVAQALAQRLAMELSRTLDVPLGEASEPATFLAAALRAYEARHRHDEDG